MNLYKKCGKVEVEGVNKVVYSKTGTKKKYVVYKKRHISLTKYKKIKANNKKNNKNGGGPKWDKFMSWLPSLNLSRRNPTNNFKEAAKFSFELLNNKQESQPSRSLSVGRIDYSKPQSTMGKSQSLNYSIDDYINERAGAAARLTKIINDLNDLNKGRIDKIKKDNYVEYNLSADFEIRPHFIQLGTAILEKAITEGYVLFLQSDKELHSTSFSY